MESIVPLAVKGGSGERDGGHLGRIWFLACIVEGLIALRFHLQPRVSGGGRDEFHDDFVTHQRFSPPILGDVAEEPMLDLVPLAGRWGEMTDADFQAEFAAQLCQTPFPEVATSAIAAAAIRRDE